MNSNGFNLQKNMMTSIFLKKCLQLGYCWLKIWKRRRVGVTLVFDVSLLLKTWSFSGSGDHYKAQWNSFNCFSNKALPINTNCWRKKNIIHNEFQELFFFNSFSLPSFQFLAYLQSVMTCPSPIIFFLLENIFRRMLKKSKDVFWPPFLASRPMITIERFLEIYYTVFAISQDFTVTKDFLGVSWGPLKHFFRIVVALLIFTLDAIFLVWQSGNV